MKQEVGGRGRACRVASVGVYGMRHYRLGPQKKKKKKKVRGRDTTAAKREVSRGRGAGAGRASVWSNVFVCRVM